MEFLRGKQTFFVPNFMSIIIGVEDITIDFEIRQKSTFVEKENYKMMFFITIWLKLRHFKGINRFLYQILFTDMPNTRLPFMRHKTEEGGEGGIGRGRVPLLTHPGSQPHVSQVTGYLNSRFFYATLYKVLFLTLSLF